MEFSVEEKKKGKHFSFIHSRDSIGETKVLSTPSRLFFSFVCLLVCGAAETTPDAGVATPPATSDGEPQERGRKKKKQPLFQRFSLARLSARMSASFRSPPPAPTPTPPTPPTQQQQQQQPQPASLPPQPTPATAAGVNAAAADDADAAAGAAEPAPANKMAVTVQRVKQKIRGKDKDKKEKEAAKDKSIEERTPKKTYVSLIWIRFDPKMKKNDVP